MDESEQEESLEYPALSSLDIIAYGYLKEELTNTSTSKEVQTYILMIQVLFMRDNFKNLVQFVKFMDEIFDYWRKNPLRVNKDNKLLWNQNEDFTEKLMNSLYYLDQLILQSVEV